MGLADLLRSYEEGQRVKELGPGWREKLALQRGQVRTQELQQRSLESGLESDELRRNQLQTEMDLDKKRREELAKLATEGKILHADPEINRLLTEKLADERARARHHLEMQAGETGLQLSQEELAARPGLRTRQAAESEADIAAKRAQATWYKNRPTTPLRDTRRMPDPKTVEEAEARARRELGLPRTREIPGALWNWGKMQEEPLELEDLAAIAKRRDELLAASGFRPIGDPTLPESEGGGGGGGESEVRTLEEAMALPEGKIFTLNGRRWRRVGDSAEAVD